MISEPDLAWKLYAECRGMDPDEAMEIFYPPEAVDGGKVGGPNNVQRLHVYDRARAICARCPVREECYYEAMDEPEWHSNQHGFRGGLSPAQRLKRYNREHCGRNLGWCE